MDASLSGSLNITDNLRINSRNAIKYDQCSLSFGDKAGNLIASGSGNIMLGERSNTDSSNSVNRISLGNAVIATKDNSIFTYKDLAPVLGIPSNLMYDSTTGQIGPMPSSVKYKKFVTKLPQNLSKKIYKLKPKHFIMEDAGPRRFESIGLLAEEVYRVLPEITVTTNGIPSGIRYDLLSVLLLNELHNIKHRLIRKRRHNYRSRKIQVLSGSCL